MISSIFLKGPFFSRVLHDELGRFEADARQRGDLRRRAGVEVDDLRWRGDRRLGRALGFRGPRGDTHEGGDEGKR